MRSEYAYATGNGENLLALDGLELAFPTNSGLEEEQVYNLWDNDVEEDLNGLRRFRGKRDDN